MDDERTLNLLGALALGLVDIIDAVIKADTGHGGEFPAAIVTLGSEPGISINTLRQILKLSHPGTVRLIDRLETAGLAERRSGADRRTHALFLTEAGYERRRTILAKRRQQLQFAFDCLTSTERSQLADLLEKMLTAITTSESRALTICRLCEFSVCPSEHCPVEQARCKKADK
jgi:DNA-binding MarR family transcriptional regulator